MSEPDRAAHRGVRRSIFLKLFLIYAVTTVALIVAVSGYSRMVLHNDELFKQTRSRMLAHHLGHVIEELGHPPDVDRAIRLSQQLGLQIRVEGPGSAWATDESLPASSALNVHHTHADLGTQIGKYRGRRFVIMDREPARFVFFFPESPELDVESILIIIGMVALILTCSYGVVRWLFRPLDWLTQGVAEVAHGNLDHRVPIRSNDELGQLTGALNDMVTRIREMLRARDRLLLDVSHELRSPLTRMKVALEFVRDEPTKEKLGQEIRELETMVTELLESERLDSDYGGVTLTDADLVPLVQDAVRASSHQNPGVRVVAAPQSLFIPMDGNRIRMVLRNLLDNALKHSMPDRGPVEVRIEANGDRATVSVRDYGPGIPPEEQALIFEPFYRVDKSRARATGGYGLGLSLVKKIMTAHHGDIAVSSESGKGSTFTLIFPLSKSHAADARELPTRSARAPGSSHPEPRVAP